MILTDKPLEPLVSKLDDVSAWNGRLNEYQSKVSSDKADYCSLCILYIILGWRESGNMVQATLALHRMFYVPLHLSALPRHNALQAIRLFSQGKAAIISRQVGNLSKKYSESDFLCFDFSEAHLLALSAELERILKRKLSKIEFKTELLRYLQVALWGNKADLSLSGGDSQFLSATLFTETASLRQNILADDLDLVTEKLMK